MLRVLMAHFTEKARQLKRSRLTRWISFWDENAKMRGKQDRIKVHPNSTFPIDKYHISNTYSNIRNPYLPDPTALFRYPMLGS